MHLSTKTRTLLLCATLTTLVSSTLAQSSIRSYGTATAGTGGKRPFLWTTTTPRVNTPTFGLTIENGLPKAPAVGFFAFQTADVKLGGVQVLVNLNAALQLPFTTLDANGAGGYPLGIPNDTSLLSLSGFAQVFIGDAGGAPLGFSATQALALKMAAPGLLLTPKQAVELATGKVSSLTGTNFTAYSDVTFLNSRAHALVTSTASKVGLFDVQSTTAPKFVTSFSTKRTPWSATAHPDGIRAYVVNQGPNGSNPEVEVFWAIPGASNFGQPYPGKTIPLGSVIDAMEMHFPGNGSVGILATLGLFGGGADFRKYDTNPSSTTYHQVLANYQFSGKYCFSSALTPDGKVLAVAVASLGSYGDVYLIDVATMKLIDGDPKTAGVQPLGPTTRVANSIIADPRGKYVFVGTSQPTPATGPASIRRFVVDQSRADFGNMTTTSTGIPTTATFVDALAISDAGDKLYASSGTVINEYDVETLKLLRTFSNTGAQSIVVR